MHNGLIVTRKKYLIALLNNTSLIGNVEATSLNEVGIQKCLNNIGVTYIESIPENKERIIGAIHTYDYKFIIFDDLNYYDTSPQLLNRTFYFIPSIDYNITDPEIVNRFQLSKDEKLFPIEWCNNHYKNLFFLTSTILDYSNNIFDLSLVLNLNHTSELWGKYHHSARNLFLASPRKKLRMDYTFREVKKENRVRFLLKLIENLNEKQLKRIKITAHGDFLNNGLLYSEVKTFFESKNEYSLFAELEKLNHQYFSFDELENHIPGYNAWPLNKLFNHTFSSDISVYFESGRDVDEIRNTMSSMITEKTIDFLSVGKSFIYMSPIVEKFLQKFGFIDYNKFVFDEISTDKIELIKTILDYNFILYDVMMKKLDAYRDANLKIMDKYYQNNTFLPNLLHN
jgi:hypothetical protein